MPFLFSSVLLKAKYYILFALSFGFIFQSFANKKYNRESLRYKHDSVKTLFHNLEVCLPAIYKTQREFGKLNFVAGPVFSQNYRLTISELTSIGTNVDTITASDPEGNVLTYTIQAGNTNGAFLLDSVTGILKISKHLNHHTQAQYSLIVKATDVAGLSAETSVSILVETSNTAPILSSFIWETVANQPYAVNEAQGKAVNNKLYTFGGFDSQKSGFTPTDRAYVYEPNLNKWTALAPLPPMNGTKHGGVTHAGIATDGTDIYLAGGYTSNMAGTGQIFGTKEVWKYTVAENRYERLPDLPIVVAAGQLEYVNGRLHHIGGTNQARTEDLSNHYVLELDKLTNGWKTLAPVPMPRHHAGSAVYEGKIYYIGGQTGHDRNLVTQKEVYTYDLVSNTWSKKADLPVPTGSSGRGHISSAVLVAGNRILVLAGETAHSSAQTNLVSAYNPGTDTWENLTTLPQARFSGIAALLNNSIFYTGGSRTNTTFKSSPVLPPTQNLITNLINNSGGVYSFGELIIGATIYTDRTYQVKSLPTALNKSLFIKTPNNDKSLTGTEVFSFELSKSATLYTAYDSRVKVLPAWLNEWQKLKDTLTTTDPIYGTYYLYSKTFPAGKVTLAGNMAAPASGVLSNYFVIIVPANTTGVQQNLEKAEIKYKLFPNPAELGRKTTLILSGLTSKEIVNITVQDVTGRQVYTHQVKANQEGAISTEFTPSPLLPRGMYLVAVNGATGKAQVKLLIQ